MQLPGDDPVCVGGEAPSSVRTDRQLQRGDFRLPDVQRALRSILLALLPRLQPPRTQHPADPTGRRSVSLPGNQRVGPERRGGRPHVLKRPEHKMEVFNGQKNNQLQELEALTSDLTDTVRCIIPT